MTSHDRHKIVVAVVAVTSLFQAHVITVTQRITCCVARGVDGVSF